MLLEGEKKKKKENHQNKKTHHTFILAAGVQLHSNANNWQPLLQLFHQGPHSYQAVAYGLGTGRYIQKRFM